MTWEITGRIRTESLLVSSEKSGSGHCHANLTQRLVLESIDLSIAFSVDPEAIREVWLLAFCCEIIEKHNLFVVSYSKATGKGNLFFSPVQLYGSWYPALLGLAWPLVIYLCPGGLSIHCSMAGLGFYARLLPAIKTLLLQHLYNLLCSHSDRHETLFFTRHLVIVVRLSDKHSSP